MKVYVDHCWSGGNNYKFRLTFADPMARNGSVESIYCSPGDNWNRSYAKTALDLLQNVYGQNRKSIRFIHR
jgi:hypothetical protein